MDVYIPHEKRDLDQSMNIDYWPRCLLDIIEWFKFQDILEHTDFHAKGDNIFIFIIEIISYLFQNFE